LRTTLGQTSGLADDLHHFEVLSNILPRRFWGRNLEESRQLAVPSATEDLPFASAFSIGDATGARASARNLNDVGPAELVDRAELASAIAQSGEPALAMAELGKVLILDPNQIGARVSLVSAAIAAGQLDDALENIETVFDDPRLTDYLREEQDLIERFHNPKYRPLIELLRIVSRKCCANGRTKEGQVIARRALDLALAADRPTGELHYTLARALVAGEANEDDIFKAAEHLFHAFVAHPPYFQAQYQRDATFNATRRQIDGILARKRDPRVEYNRRLAAVAPTKGR
jgi:hypothetical protein